MTVRGLSVWTERHIKSDIDWWNSSRQNGPSQDVQTGDRGQRGGTYLTFIADACLLLFFARIRLSSIADSVSSSCPPRLSTAAFMAWAFRFRLAAKVTISSVRSSYTIHILVFKWPPSKLASTSCFITIVHWGKSDFCLMCSRCPVRVG